MTVGDARKGIDPDIGMPILDEHEAGSGARDLRDRTGKRP
jgi:hypothetical protein